MIESEPEVLKGFLRASAKGFEDFKKDPDGCLAILMNNQNEENFPLTQSVEEKSCETLLPLMEDGGCSVPDTDGGVLAGEHRLDA